MIADNTCRVYISFYFFVCSTQSLVSTIYIVYVLILDYMLWKTEELSRRV
jgi:hypothetical protein